MKKNSGITILQIVITIIILVIIISITFLYGQNVPKEAKISTLYNEMKDIEDAFVELNMLNNIEIKTDSIVLCNKVEVPKIEASDYEKQLSGEDKWTYYYLDFKSSKDLGNLLEMDNVKNDYILDFDNFNVYLVDGIEIDGKMIYSSDEISKYYEDTVLK